MACKGGRGELCSPPGRSGLGGGAEAADSQKEESMCHRPNVCVPQNSYAELIPHSVIALGGGGTLGGDQVMRVELMDPS